MYYQMPGGTPPIPQRPSSNKIEINNVVEGETVHQVQADYFGYTAVVICAFYFSYILLFTLAFSFS